jgi:hypothetical protein
MPKRSVRAVFVSWCTILVGLLTNLATGTVQVASKWWVIAVWAGLAVVVAFWLWLQRAVPANDDAASGSGGGRQFGASVTGDRSVAIGGDNRGDIRIG